MKPLVQRIWFTAALMCVFYLGTVWVRAGYSFEVQPLSRPLSSIPMELDGWSGTDIPLDDGVAEIMNAQESLNRVYRNPDGSVVVVSISAWLRPETVSEAAPHLPKICYTNSGWQLVSERDVRIGTPRGDLPFATALLEKRGERIVIGYWYQMGDSYFTTTGQARRIHRQYWGQRKWPGTFKMLLQTSASSIDAGLPLIERFASITQRQISEVSGEKPAPK